MTRAFCSGHFLATCLFLSSRICSTRAAFQISPTNAHFGPRRRDSTIDERHTFTSLSATDDPFVCRRRMLLSQIAMSSMFFTTNAALGAKQEDEQIWETELFDQEESIKVDMMQDDIRQPSAASRAKENVFAKTAEPFICGGIASAFASGTIHPVDLAKVRLQLYGQRNPGQQPPSFISLLSDLVREEGILSAYRGVDAAIGRQLVYGTARIGLHRTFSDYLVEMNGGKPISFPQKVISSMASGSIAVCVGTPFDIALVRLQADSMAPLDERRNYTNVFDGITRTVSEEGAGTLYTGLVPNILRGVSNSIGLLACYDQAKEVVAEVLNDPMTNGPSLSTKLGSSAIAGFTQALFSTPFDVIKSRLMAQKPDPETGELPYSGIVDCGAKIFEKEGIAGFFRGFTAYYGRCAPQSMIALTSMESITEAYRKTFY